MKMAYQIVENVYNLVSEIHDTVRVGELRNLSATAPALIYIDLDMEESRPHLNSTERRLRFAIRVVSARLLTDLESMSTAFELADKIKKALENKIMEIGGIKVIFNYNDASVSYDIQQNVLQLIMRFIAQYRE